MIDDLKAALESVDSITVLRWEAGSLDITYKRDSPCEKENDMIAHRLHYPLSLTYSLLPIEPSYTVPS